MASVPAAVGPAEMGSAPLAIQLRGLRKRFRKFTARGQYTTFKTSLVRQLFGGQAPKPRWLQVLDGIDLDVPRGQAVGVIGRNGSGKSTLLKLVAGIFKPDAGTVRVDGRISPLIELGAGFHPEFSGRENIYLNGIVLGLSRAQIDERLDAIVDFAELRDSIDDPVRTYSSGMYMRLGFAIAIHADPDILLVDEILAVGDQAFTHKCHQWLADFLGEGKTVLLVSHSLSAVERWCREAIWLDQGRIRARGAARDVIQSYLESTDAFKAPTRSHAALDPSLRAAARIEAVSIADLTEPRARFRYNDPVSFDIDYLLNRATQRLDIDVAIRRADGLCCYKTSTRADGVDLRAVPGLRRVRCRFGSLKLLDGSYTLDVAIVGEDGSTIDQRVGAVAFTFESDFSDTGVFRPNHDWVIVDSESDG